jgi:hypothetical protein
VNIDVNEILRVVDSLTPEELTEIERDGEFAMAWCSEMFRRYPEICAPGDGQVQT